MTKDRRVFKFNELCDKAQNCAAIDYISGWYETHDSDEDRITVRQAKIILQDSDDVYTKQGIRIYDN